MEDSALVEGINRKSEVALKRLYDRYYSPLCVYAEKLLNDNGYAEDVVQLCLIKVWDADLTFSDIRELSAWLYKSVYHAAVDIMRERAAFKELENDRDYLAAVQEGEAVDMALREEVITCLHEILNCLSPQQREILLYTLKGCKVREIAALLHVSENAVKMQKKRAYQYVRDHFDPDKLRFLLTIFFLSNPVTRF